MPARGKTFTCFCAWCKETSAIGSDGEPMGVTILETNRAAHRLRATREMASRTSYPEPSAAEPSVQDQTNDIANQIIIDTLTADYQTSTSTPPIPSATEVVEAVLDGMQRLSMLEGSSKPPPLQNATNFPVPAPPHADTATNPSDKRKGVAKREKSTHTKKAHKILNGVERRARSCLDGAKKLSEHSVPSELSSLKIECAVVEKALASVTCKVPSINLRRSELQVLLGQVTEELEAANRRMPKSEDKSQLVFDSKHHFNPTVNSFNPIAQMTMFIVVVCTVFLGVGRNMANMILRLITINIRYAFLFSSGTCNIRQEAVLDQIPSTLETVLAKFNLDGKKTILAACPECHFTYYPSESGPRYPRTCSNRPYPDADICGAPITESTPDHAATPLKPYPVYSFEDYLASLLSRHDVETIADEYCDRIVADIDAENPPPEFLSDASEADFVRKFEGPKAEKLFLRRPGSEGRYLFAFNVDFFNPEGLNIRGASKSSGIISAACLNLPLDIRYKPENMYLAAIIPGPSEPRLTELNHYMKPVVDSLLVSWERGVFLTRTANHPAGRLTRSAMAAAVCDLPGARKVSQMAAISSHFYCSVCNCFHKTTRGRTDYENWVPKDPATLRAAAEAWRNAPTRVKQDNLFSSNGVRWSELWRLPYWNPQQMLVVDSMHCLFENLVEFHFRHVLKLTDTDAKEKEKRETPDAFAFNFPAPVQTKSVKLADLPPHEHAHISQTHSRLLAPLPDSSPETQASLVNQLVKANKSPLMYVTESLGLVARNTHGTTTGVIHKEQYAETLVTWRLKQPLSSTEIIPPIATPEVMGRIRQVIKETDTPSWIESVPRNFGESKAGTLKADEWRTMSTIYLPLALISMWGTSAAGLSSPSSTATSYLQTILDHTMLLVSAVTLACKRTMTSARRSAYLEHLRTWVSQLKGLHPEANDRTNTHMAFHIYDFLKLFGPVRSWWCFPFERLIGQLQRLPHNHKNGEMEATMAASFTKAARLRLWLNRPDCPAALRECRAVFEKAFGGGTDNQTPADSAFADVPEHLRSLLRVPKIALRARHIVNKIVYARSSTHVGNSLITFYPDGKYSNEPVPASIQEIAVQPNGTTQYLVRRQLQADIQYDPYARYPHFPASLYKNALSTDLEIVEPSWVFTHYARWSVDQDHAVVLILSRD